MVKKDKVSLEMQAEDFMRNFPQGRPRSFVPKEEKEEVPIPTNKKELTKGKFFHSLLHLGKKRVPK